MHGPIKISVCTIIASNGVSTGGTEELKTKADKQQEWLTG